MAIITKNLIQDGMTANADTTDSMSADGGITFNVVGTWDTATATLKISDDGGSTWLTAVDITAVDIAFTSNARITYISDITALYKVTISSVGASTDLDVKLLRG